MNGIPLQYLLEARDALKAVHEAPVFTPVPPKTLMAVSAAFGLLDGYLQRALREQTAEVTQ